MEEKKEPTALEKLQAEYNQLISFLGHNIAQQLHLQKEESSLKERIQKISAKAANISQKPEEKKDGASSES